MGSVYYGAGGKTAEQTAAIISSYAINEAYYKINRERGYFVKQAGGSLNVLQIVTNSDGISIREDAQPDFRVLYTFICVFDTVTTGNHDRLAEAQKKSAQMGMVADFVIVDAGMGLYENLGSRSMMDRQLEKALKGALGANEAQPVTRQVAAENFTNGYKSSSMTVIYVLICINLAVYILGFLMEIMTGYDPLYAFGVLDPGLVAQGQYWRLVTAMFLHADIVHIFGNMYMLLMLGRALSPQYSKGRMLLIYMLSGVAGCALSAAFSGYRSLGASGAIRGLGGALLCEILLSKDRSRYRHTSTYVYLGVMILFNLFYGLFVSGIDNYGHFGGFIAGFLLELLFMKLKDEKPQKV